MATCGIKGRPAGRGGARWLLSQHHCTTPLPASTLPPIFFLLPQAAGYPSGLTPARMVAAAGGGGAGWAGGLQDSLLSTVLKCAKAKPKLAAAFLGYATAGARGWLAAGLRSGDCPA